MMKEIIYKKEIIYCPICDEEHEIEFRKIKKDTIIKECKIQYNALVYYCQNTREEFENGELLDINLQSMRDSYRIKNGLLTKDEIVSIRTKFNLSQEDLSKILGFGEKTIARYETNTIQDKPYDALLRQFNEDYNFAYNMLRKSKDKFTSEKFNKISDTIKGFITIESNELLNETQLKNMYIVHDKECSSNGYRLLQIDKIKSMLAYFAKFTKNLYTVKLMKLFWYSDVLSYSRTGRAMTGLVYTHMPQGALPIGYKEICELNSIDREYEEICDNIAVKFIPKSIDNINESLFTLEELKILNEVCDKFCNITGSKLSEIMHEEKIYKVTEEKQILDFSLIDKVKAF